MTTSAIIFQTQSVLIVSLMLYGVYHRKNRFRHVKTMKTAIIWDLLLVAQIELTRGAIATASKPFENPMLLNIHISFAVATVLLYGMIYMSGRKVLNGDEGFRKTHRVLGITTLTTRIATLITSFLIKLL